MYEPWTKLPDAGNWPGLPARMPNSTRTAVGNCVLFCEPGKLAGAGGCGLPHGGVRCEHLERLFYHEGCAMFEGIWVWIAELARCDGGNYDRIAARLLAAGVRGVLVQSDDGGRWDTQADAAGPAPFWRTAQELQRRGLAVAAWGRHYGAEAGAVCDGYAVAGWQQEAARAVDVVRCRPARAEGYRGPDAYVFNLELEYADRRNAALLVLRRVRAVLPAAFPLGFAPLPEATLHTVLPWRRFTDAGCAMLPRVCEGNDQRPPAAAVADFHHTVQRYGLAVPSLPSPFPVFALSSSASALPARLQGFAWQAAAHGATGLSLWRYEQIDEAGWQAVAALAPHFAVAVQPAPRPQPAVWRGR